MDLGLAGKTALVTGGSRGIGKAITRQLALEGVTVAIAARDQTVLASTAEELTDETDRTIYPLTVDTGSDASVRQMVAAAIRALGQIDILVNCAARMGGRNHRSPRSPTPRSTTISTSRSWATCAVFVRSRRAWSSAAGDGSSTSAG